MCYHNILFNNIWIIYQNHEEDFMTTLLEEFQERYTTKPTEPAKKILFAILGDLTGRRGLDNAWDDIDDDVKEELLESNLEVVKKNMS
ncbi:MAG: hypothetical protein UX49_C0049G0002 [Candidatus Wolfebacteria bacterium GW2011_GWC2_46_275]|uniref:Uncharacterized protein n=2 Tax=Candidatus Wolfeibacteriota TaxID=1752735 RepID=A0A0G1X4K0_9BACT|nr:MAG: hypothetical protein UX70_C0001G0127 [Candidatus Wolfebacteria bacterium GW2011_GWB1_47_1]KKU34408.1 MAG: hypothetical protein UX49_C0049G0002 [Candidatus Wolfebacteria bacterium GW2011_GWC2_46_275]KKU59853.1 MAG: hypothetical protein UX83_C0002G0140 [Candidatus Wolfebacteria bacterium GW2011_GWE2_47_12]KKU73268.1 MAG: hypothetical protein UX96_C0007G0065 [Candidatus Wolfebacteria bacterium GW2011_GWB1_47_243]KKU76123.1 MAG: hypothetical protein UY00_C0022G0002 [Candidatus Wolfebacteria